MLLAVLLSQAVPADAVTIDSQTAPIGTNTYDNGSGSLRQSLLNAQGGGTIPFYIAPSDPGHNDRAWTIERHVFVNHELTAR